MKRIIMAVMLMLPLAATASPVASQCRLNEAQQAVITRSVQLGESTGTSQTLAAIAMVESYAGKYLRNDVTKDYGVYQINLFWATKRIEQLTGAPMTNKQKAAFKERLITDHSMNATHAIDILMHYNKVHNGNWRRVVMSYNAGNNWNSKAGQTYLTKVQKQLIMLKQCKYI